MASDAANLPDLERLEDEGLLGKAKLFAIDFDPKIERMDEADNDAMTEDAVFEDDEV